MVLNNSIERPFHVLNIENSYPSIAHKLTVQTVSLSQLLLLSGRFTQLISYNYSKTCIRLWIDLCLIVIIQNNPNSVYCTPAKSLPRPFHIEARTHLWNSVSVPVTSPLRSIHTADILQLFKNVYTFMNWSFPEEELRVIQNNPNSVYSSIAAWNNEMINCRRIGPLRIESIQPC